MSMLNKPDQIPTVGDAVKSVEVSDDGSIVRLKFLSGKMLVSHLSDFRFGKANPPMVHFVDVKLNKAGSVADYNQRQESDQECTSAMHCNHANECPYNCDCDDKCYCRVKGSCRNRA